MALRRVKSQPNFGRIFFIGVAVFIALIIISLYMSSPSFFKIPETPGITSTETQTTTPSRIETGTIIIALTDKSQRVDAIGTLNELLITVTKAEVHYIGESDDLNSTGEWKTVFNGNKNIDLLTLTDLNGIVVQEDLSVGKYTQVRLTLSDVIFNITNTLINAKNKRYPASVTNSSGIPSGTLYFVHPFNITSDKITAIIIDFDIQQSVIRTADGYMLKPVVKISEQTLDKGQLPENSVVI